MRATEAPSGGAAGAPGRGRDALGVFVKAPIPGRVKTRLARDVGAEAAARFFEASARAVLRTAGELSEFDRWIFHAPEEAEARCRAIEDPERPVAGARYRPQRGEGLGERMSRAFDTMFGASARAVLIGSDLPTLAATRVRDAIALLDAHDLVLGPARDGGYYLIALGVLDRRAGLFEGVAWSTERVLEQTLARAAAAGLAVALLPEARDVDTIDDLVALRDELARAPNPVNARLFELCEEVLRGRPSS